MEGARRLYEDGWGHTVAGYVTDYAIFLVALICLLLTMMRHQARKAWSIAAQLSVWQATSALTFGFGGVAHHMIDHYYNSGGAMGKSWFEDNSGWMYAWFVSMVMAPVAVSAFIALGLVNVGYKYAPHIALVAYVLGCIVALYEALALLITSAVDSSGVANTMWSLVGTVASILVMLAGARQPLMLMGGVALFVGFCIVSFAPAGCMKLGEPRDCPFPEDFNQNAVFHVFVILSVPLVSFGAWTLETTAKDSKVHAEVDIQNADGTPH